ncbi:OLC1v1022492C1 [Oldenlandia corymbosa var. corymbosa]|uniref:OLC1v1022492C1 n=1 Tax=Oldenlandia corymbosa var. corymbosa TaxID=529605 RepID=A0AAV1C1N8_OLDCO|nr:OLC1v1022492C1 [Oldenlandia corymbosa var. corymbosa]
MRKVLPPHAKISDDCKEIIQAYTSEFISFITSEANERSRCDCRKTVSAEDVLYSLNHLGFHNYVNPLTLYLYKYQQREAARTVVRGDPFVRRTTDFSTIVQQSTAAPLPPPSPPQHVPPPYMPNMITTASSHENYHQHGLYGQVPTSSFHYYDSGASSSDTTQGQGESSSNSSLAPFHPFSRGFDPSRIERNRFAVRSGLEMVYFNMRSHGGFSHWDIEMATKAYMLQTGLGKVKLELIIGLLLVFMVKVSRVCILLALKGGRSPRIVRWMSMNA